MPDLDLRPERRDLLVRQIIEALVAAMPDGVAASRGSLASGTADAYSDIDLIWTVPDGAFHDALAAAEPALGSVRPVVSVRVDPSLARSDRRRLLFVRLGGVPLFWRLDLDIRAASVAEIEGYDDENPAAISDRDWSRTASALANAIGVLKATLRHQPEVAEGLLHRGFERIGAASLPLGAPRRAILALVAACEASDSTLHDLATEVASMVDLLLPSA